MTYLRCPFDPEDDRSWAGFNQTAVVIRLKYCPVSITSHSRDVTITAEGLQIKPLLGTHGLKAV